METKISFGGHYNLGEKVRDVQFQTILCARSEGTPVGILIGDIDFNQKVAAYIQRGIEGVKDSYRKRLARNPSGCVLRQIPKEEELDDVIDEEQYNFASGTIREHDPIVYHFLKKIPLDVQETELTGIHQSLATFIREQVTVQLGAERMLAYGLRTGTIQPDVRLYSERELKNNVAKRMRPSRKGSAESWRPVIESIQSPLVRTVFQEVQTRNGIPACRGIMLALYELLSTEGFEEVSQHYSTRDELAVQNATDLYNALHKEFPDDARWKLHIQNNFYQEERTGGQDYENSGYC